MIWLASVLAAEPARRASGGVVALPVAGLRGDLSVWVFRCEGLEEVSMDSGPLPAIKLVRENRGLYDPEIEVWLDPARHHLPIRVTLRAGAAAQALELAQQDLVFEP